MKFIRNTQAEDVQINLTPLIDVVFLLLIFFMVTTSFTKESRLNIQLPEAEGEVVVADLEVIEVTISAQNRIAINGMLLTNDRRETLLVALQKLITEQSQPVTVTADAVSEHQTLVMVLDVLGQLGISNLRIATKRPEAKS